VDSQDVVLRTPYVVQGFAVKTGNNVVKRGVVQLESTLSRNPTV
jgi:hypothetical protein